MGDTNEVVVRANIRLLSTAEGGPKGPRWGSYRPNHNFFGPDSRTMSIGVMDIPESRPLHPGESMEIAITFIYWPGLEDQIYVGREWSLHEGVQLMGFGTVLEILSTPDSGASFETPASLETGAARPPRDEGVSSG